MDVDATHHDGPEAPSRRQVTQVFRRRTEVPPDDSTKREAMNTSYSATAITTPAWSTFFRDLLTATPAYLFIVGVKAALAQSR
jgi:hypothetical protein